MIQNSKKVILYLTFAILLLFPLKTARGWYLFWRDGTCKATGFPCRSTVERSMRGSCCVHPVNSATCEASNYCTGTLFFHWRKELFPIKWHTNFNKVPGLYSFSLFSDATVTDTFKRAWKKWAQVKCADIREKYAGQTASKAVPGDGKNVFYIPTPKEWAQMGVSLALAFTLFIPKKDGQLEEADIVFNPHIQGGQYLWADKTDIKQRRFSLLAVTLHELGHFFGLAHNTQKDSIMNITRSTDRYYATAPKKDDVQGICWLYPARNSCQTDGECAKCYSCKNGVCTPLPSPSTKVCQPCKSDSDCGQNSKCIKTPDGNRCFQLCAQKGGENCCPRGYTCKKVDSQNLCIPVKGHCPLKKCNNNYECGLGICRKNTNYCAAPIPFDYSRCGVSCTNSAQCGNPLFKCVPIQGGRKRCLMRCFKGDICPYGYTCRNTPQGRYCTPTNEICPCLEEGDCPSGMICKDNLCQRPNGFQKLEPCGGISCAKGLVCVNLSNHFQCVKKCRDSRDCDSGSSCYRTYLGSLCLGKFTRLLGSKCSLKENCHWEFSCLYPSHFSKGICIQTCERNKTCKYGGTCGGNPLFPIYCSCKSDGECAKGYFCASLGGGFKTCLPCKNPPCKTKEKAICGDGICQHSGGENCITCPYDCSCPNGQTCINGTCTIKKCPSNQTLCRELITNREICVDTRRDPDHCGKCNLKCQRCEDGKCINQCPAGQVVCYINSTPRCVDLNTDSENCGKCENRCPAGFVCSKGKCQNPNGACGNGTSDLNENCSSCPTDCACPPGQLCNSGTCQAITQPEKSVRESANSAERGESPKSYPHCGNGTCELQWDENCFTCPSDCACPFGTTCYEGYCIKNQKLCPSELQKKKCDADGKNCITVCSSGCNCQAEGSLPPALGLLLLLSALFGAIRLRKKKLSAKKTSAVI